MSQRWGRGKGRENRGARRSLDKASNPPQPAAGEHICAQMHAHAHVVRDRESGARKEDQKVSREEGGGDLGGSVKSE